MRGGQTLLNSGDLAEQRKTFLKKLFKNRPIYEMSLGNKMGLDRFLNYFLSTFLNKGLNFFDLVYSRYSDPSGDFAPLPCTVYLVYI